MSSAVSGAKIVHSLFFFLYFSNVASSFCYVKVSTGRFTCENTSLEDYVYEIVQLKYKSQIDVFLNNLEIAIINSDIPALARLQNPFRWTNSTSKVSKFVLNSCKITKVSEEAFSDFRWLDEVDLAFNQIKDLGFMGTLRSNVRKLNLSHNNIESVDLQPTSNFKMIELDLSFNLIVQVVIFPTLSGKLFLNDNSIEKVEFALDELAPLEKLRVNLDNNRIKSFVSHSISNTGKIFYRLQEFSMPSYFRASNCSFSNISIPSFLKYDVLNFSYNQIKIVEIFKPNIIPVLDLSHNHLEDITFVFREVNIYELNLSHNRIKQLNNNSLPLDGQFTSLDVSFNPNLKLHGGTFEKQNYLKVLRLAGCNMSVLEESVFTGLIVLSELDLSHNQFQRVPPQLFRPLSGIHSINLSHNKLSVIPSQFIDAFNPSVQMRLDFSDNDIRNIENAAFSYSFIFKIILDNNRRFLTISNSSFVGSFIDTLSMRNCKFRSIDFKVFFGMLGLDHLDLGYSRIPQIEHSYNTSSVRLSHLNLTFEGRLQKRYFQNLPSLSGLYFENSVIEAIEPGAFEGLFSLKFLHLLNSTVRNVSSRALDGLFQIEQLDAQNLFASSEILPRASFRHLKRLSQLDLSGLHLKDIEPWAFEGLKELRHLDLSNNSLVVLRSGVFFGLGELQALDLSKNRLTVLRSDIFCNLTGLKVLHLDSNEIHDINLGALQQFPQLLKLSLARNNLTLFKVGAFSNLLQLKNLNLERNSISSLLFEAFLPMKSLKTLNLEHNNLKTIEHVSLVSNLRNLRRIGIANNKWRCDYLAELLVTFRNHHIDYSAENLNFLEDNIDGIKCIDVCKFLLCLKDSHGIN